jgi:3-hydroxyacyl-[acyl-carrier-protein] dehydratase
LDEVIELEPSKRCVAKKTFTADPMFFGGHFPGAPVLPGVVMLEALAQTGAVAVLSMEEYRGRIALFGGADKVKFRHQVLPGDTLEFHVDIHRVSGIGGRGCGTAYVNGETACQGDITFVFLPEGV